MRAKKPLPSERSKFDLDLISGEEWEDDFLALITNSKIECKRDRITQRTGNVFIEYQCRGKPSGLAVTEADWWAIGIENNNGDIETSLLVSVPWLKETCRKYYKTERDVIGGDDNLSHGILLKMDDLRFAP